MDFFQNKNQSHEKFNGHVRHSHLLQNHLQNSNRSNQERESAFFLFRFIPAWALPALVGLGVATVSLRLSVVKATYELNELNRQIKNLEQELRGIEYDIAKLESPKRLESIAKEKFGWFPPKPHQVITVRK